MQRLHFEPEHETFRDSVSRFMQQEIGPHTAAWREAGRVDKSAFRKAGEQGLLLMWADEKYGGAGNEDFRYEQILLEENARHGEPAFYINLHNRIVAPYIGRLGNEEQKMRFLPRAASGETVLAIAMTEPAAGSDVAGMRSTAREDGDCWVLNGSKTYISNGLISDVLVVAARTPGDSSRSIGLFIVEAGMDGFRRGRALKKMGMAAQDTAELFFDNVRIPKSNVLGDPQRGFQSLMQFLAEERLLRAAMDVAEAQVAFELTLDFIKDRRAFGKPIGAFQANRHTMADLRTRIDMAQTFVDQLVLLHNAGKLTGELAAEAKLYCSELVGHVTDAGVQLHGGAGYIDDYRICRMYTDARIARIYAGTNEIMKEIISRGIGLDERRM